MLLAYDARRLRRVKSKIYHRTSETLIFFKMHAYANIKLRFMKKLQFFMF
jgi:hypothetical protein